MTDIECLAFIRREYGVMIGISASAWGHRPEILAGIMCRESRGGTSPLLDVQGPAGRGDHGFAHGLMQIDSRSFPDFCAGNLWKDPAANIDFGGRVLFEKRTYLSNHTAGLHLPTKEIERASIAAYNCGQGNVIKALRDNLDVDHYTAHADYSKAVLIYSEIYRQLTLPEVIAPESELIVSNESRLRSIFRAIARLFRKETK